MDIMAENYRVLIIDDEKNVRDSIAKFLSLDGISCLGAASGPEGLECIASETFDAIVLDLRLPGMDGFAVLDRIGALGTGTPVLMMSAHGEISDAVEAMRLGAVDYLVKPFDPAELAIRLTRAIRNAREIETARLSLRITDRGDALAQCEEPSMRDLLELTRRVASTPSTVLVTGERGVGKESFAREIHRLSSRAAAPFVSVSLHSIPPALVESELFGCEKGSVPGANARKIGLFELASGGTVFLGEIEELSAQMQVKLLRVLHDRAVLRVGGSLPIPVDVRVVAASSRNIEDAVRSGSFREDLYFRLNVIRLRVPSLRDRPRDIAPLTAFFLARFARESKKDVSSISTEALRCLEKYPFPGNVLELENCVERAVALCGSGALRPEDFDLRCPLGEGSITANEASAGSSSVMVSLIPGGTGPVSVKDAEKRAIALALARNNGHRERSARELGISRRTLLTKIKEYGIQPRRVLDAANAEA